MVAAVEVEVEVVLVGGGGRENMEAREDAESGSRNPLRWLRGCLLLKSDSIPPSATVVAFGMV